MSVADNKLKQAEAALCKAAEYVAATQPLLDEQNVVRDRFIKRAHEVVGGLVARGVVRKNKSNGLLDKLAGNYVAALDLVEKMAEYIKPPELGSASDVKVASHTKLDAFERLVVTGNTHSTGVNNGMID